MPDTNPQDLEPVQNQQVDPKPNDQPAQEPVQEPVQTQPVQTPVDPAVDAASLIAENTDLITQINSMMQQPVSPPVPSTPPQASGDDGYKFDDSILDNVIDDPRSFANHIAKTIADSISQQAPMIVQTQLQQQMQAEQYAQQLHDTFYKANPNLVGQEAIVGAVANQLQQQYPTLTDQQLLQLTAQTMNKRASTNVTEQRVANETVIPMQQAGMAGNVSPQPQIPEAQSDMLDMLKDANAGQSFF